MCDPVTMSLAVASSVGSKLLSNSESQNNAAAQAAAANAVLKNTIDKENGLQATNTATQDKNLANYAPGAQDAQLKDAQGARGATSTDNMTTSSANDVPITSDAPPAVKSAIADRMLAVHDGAVNRAKLAGNLGGYGDTWLKNNLNTSAADRDIGVTNNYAEGNKAILPALQQDAMAAAYKPPSIWSSILDGASSIAAGAAGAAGKAPASAAGAAPTGGMGISLTNGSTLY